MPSKKKILLPDYGELKYKGLVLKDIISAEEETKILDGEEKGRKFINLIIDRFLEPSPINSSDLSELSSEDKGIIFSHLAMELASQEEFNLFNDEPDDKIRLFKAYSEQNRKLANEFEKVLNHSALQVQELQDGLNNMLQFESKIIQDSFRVPIEDTLMDSFNKIGALNIKLSAPPIPESLLKNFGGHAKLIADIANSSNINNLVNDLSKLNIAEPFYSTTLMLAQLDSPLIHTPSYSFPETFKTLDTVEQSRDDAERSRLLASYDTLIQLESSLRKLLRKTLTNHYGDNWWNMGVPVDVREGCEERKRENEDNYKPKYHPIEYGYILDYHKIISRKDNWKKIFKEIFSDRDQVNACFKWVADSRKPIAHSRELNKEQHMTFMTGSKWLQTRITFILDDE